MSSMGLAFTPPKGVLRGGIGEFRNPYPSTLLSNAGVATGLARRNDSPPRLLWPRRSRAKLG